MGAWRRRFHATGVVAAAAGLSLFLAGCGAGGSSSSGALDEVTIAYQPGIGYAPLIVVKEQKALETQFPDVKIKWQVLSSGAAITDGMLSGDIRVGAGGSGPLILDWAKGTGIRSLAAMNDADLWLMAKSPDIRSLKDFKKGGKIAMPSPTSIQSVVLRKAAQVQLGDAHALDSMIVAMGHPDGLQALVSGQIQGHLTSPPFEFQEQEQGAHRLLGSKDLFGSTTFNSVFMTSDFYKNQPKFAKALYDDLVSATELLNTDPKKGGQLLSKDAGGTPSPEQFTTWITNPAIKYTVAPHGLMKLAGFMKDIDMIKKQPKSWKDFTLPTLANEDGS